MNQVYEYIKTEESKWKVDRVPLTRSKDWNMSEHIERCYNVANGWFHQGVNDGSRPYDDIVTPIIDVAFRLEGFDVKDIVPYVDDVYCAYKSFLVKKYHPQWARKNELDSFIDEVVESSIIYDLVLVKDVNNVRPEVVNLQDIAFCDQTDVMAGSICIKHNYTIPELLEFKGKWKEDAIEEVIIMSKANKDVKMANDQKVKTPGKYIEVYELHGSFPENWYKIDGDPNKYVDQLHIISYYTTTDGNKNGVTLFAGKSKKLKDKFKALKIDSVRSKGRACGRSIVERLFEPQVWRNYSAIKLKKMMDSAVNLLQTDSEEFGGKKLSQLPENTILKHEPGRPISRVDMGIQNAQIFENNSIKQENSARVLGSASEASLGKAPVSGTPFALQELIVQQGEGIHQYRQGKIATFFSDVLYRDWILQYLVDEMNGGKNFSEELSLDEIQEIGQLISVKLTNKKIIELALKGKFLSTEEQSLMQQTLRAEFAKGGSRKFMEALKDELKDTPVKVKVNIVGKQRYMAQNADKLSKLISNILANPQAFAQIPGLGKAYNQLLEESGMSPIDFSQIIQGTASNPEVKTQKIASPISREELKDNQPV